MKTIKQMLITVAVLLCSATASAYDFEVDGIYYNVISTSDLTVEVTNGDNKYTGTVVIPTNVSYKSKILTVTTIGNGAFLACSGLTNINIPNSVTSIGDYAFGVCSGLTSINIPNSVTSIGDDAFDGCSGITSINIPNSVTSIGRGAFYACSGLTSVVIGNSVTSIGNQAFCACSSLTSINIPNSVTSIGYEAFSYCRRLKKVELDCTTIGTWFCGESSIEEVVLGDNVTSIGNSAFMKCSGLTSVVIGNSVTSIKVRAFYACSSLTSVVIGNSVKSIGNEAFDGCSGITKISLMGTTPPAVGSNNFTNAHFINSTVYVPQGALDAYQAVDVWKDFWDIREEGTTETPDEEVKECATPVIAYYDNGLDITSETDGAEIHTKITCSDVGSYNDSRIDLSATYNITTYATKEGYLNSETATATLCWIAVNGESEDNSIIEVEATPVLITCNNGTINICGDKEGAEVVVYTTSGVAVGNATITNGNATISTGLAKGEIAVVNIAGWGIKVVMQ